jgi:hypothetical protein
MDNSKVLQPLYMNHRNLKYLYSLLLVVLWCSNFICYYFWCIASIKLQKIAKYNGINDPTSLQWDSNYYSIIDNTLLIGISTGIILMFLTLFFFRKKILGNKFLVFGLLGIVLFLIICFGGFLLWWID